jgi:DNA transformation protein and related proteins
VHQVISKTRRAAAARPGILAEGGFGAFVLDQLSALGDVIAKPMFGGAGFYLDGEFFGLLFKERLYFRVSPETVNEYTSRKMKPFEPFEKRGRRGASYGYYEVPLDILESPEDLVKWARAARQTPPLTAQKQTRKRKVASPRRSKKKESR